MPANAVQTPPSLPRLKPVTVISPNVAANTERLLQGKRSRRLANAGKQLKRAVDGLSTFIQLLLEGVLSSQQLAAYLCNPLAISQLLQGIYRIPPRPAAGGHRSGEWRIADEIFTGRLRVVAKQEQLDIRIEDAATGELFALYYVLRVEDPATQRHAFLGLGFTERGEAFDFNAALVRLAIRPATNGLLAEPGSSGTAMDQLTVG
eukprot:gene12681-12810_t